MYWSLKASGHWSYSCYLLNDHFMSSGILHISYLHQNGCTDSAMRTAYSGKLSALGFGDVMPSRFQEKRHRSPLSAW